MSKKNISGITKIAVKGFKSIAEEREIDIRPLTLLAGANSSGKSSIMQPLLLLKQTLEALYDPGPLKIDGPNVWFTETWQFLSTLSNDNGPDYFQVRIETRKSDSFHAVKTTFGKGKNGIEIVKMTKERLEADSTLSVKPITLYPEMTPEEIQLLSNQDSAIKNFDIVKRSRCFLYFGSRHSSGFYEVTYGFGADILNAIHLPGLRGNPERTYQQASTGPQYPGTFENYVASVIHEWQEKQDERLETLTDALHTLGLTGKVGTEKVGEVGIELQVSRLPHERDNETDMVNIADVGFGISQVLPALVAIIVAKPGQLVYLEQPELHLHPRAQVALAQVLADAAKRGVHVVAETHSSLLLLGIQTLVAEGDLSPELVKLHWFTRREDGVTEVTSADLDEAGAYGDWPEDFDDVDLKTQSRYIKAAQSRFVEGT